LFLGDDSLQIIHQDFVLVSTFGFFAFHKITQSSQDRDLLSSLTALTSSSLISQ